MFFACLHVYLRYRLIIDGKFYHRNLPHRHTNNLVLWLIWPYKPREIDWKCWNNRYKIIAKFYEQSSYKLWPRQTTPVQTDRGQMSCLRRAISTDSWQYELVKVCYIDEEIMACLAHSFGFVESGCERDDDTNTLYDSTSLNQGPVEDCSKTMRSSEDTPE